MWLLHDASGAGHLDNTWPQTREEGQQRAEAESKHPWRSTDSGTQCAERLSHFPGLFYPRLRPSSTSATATLMRALSPDNIRTKREKQLPFAVKFTPWSARSPATGSVIFCAGDSASFPAVTLAGNSWEVLASSTDWPFPRIQSRAIWMWFRCVGDRVTVEKPGYVAF